MNGKNRFLFEEESVLTAIFRLALPTIASQIILVIYNMADTFFISMTDSDVKLSAVTLCMPAFMLISAIANLFGVGGAATVSRANGALNPEKAAHASGFSFYGCIFVTVLYSAAVWIGIDKAADLLGAVHPEIHAEAVQYLILTIGAGGLCTAMNSFFSHLVRSEGRSFAAGFGIMFGSILNIILDPLFMFVLLPEGQEVRAVAAATAVSNVIATLYFVILLIRIRKMTSISFHFTLRPLHDGTAREILATGLPACLMTLFENISYAVLGHLMAYAGVACQAGIGVAKKVNMLAHCITRGMTQGVLPLIAFNYSNGNYRRMKKAVLISSLMSVFLSLLCMGASLIFGRAMIRVFIDDGTALESGAIFLKILCLGCPFSAFAYAVISFLQAVAESRKSFLLAILRKGVVDIPLMYIIFKRVRPEAIVWATPVADFICCVTAVAVLIPCMKLMKETSDERLRSVRSTGKLMLRAAVRR